MLLKGKVIDDIHCAKIVDSSFSRSTRYGYKMTFHRQKPHNMKSDQGTRHYILHQSFSASSGSQLL